MKYFRLRYGGYRIICTLDENGNAHYQEEEKGKSWLETESVSPLEAVVKLGVGAFPPNTTKKKVHKFFGALFDVVRVFKQICEKNGNFIWGSLIVAIFIVLLGGTTYMMCQAFSRDPTDKTAAPQSIMIRYSDDTTLEYPIENKAPRIVEIRK